METYVILQAQRLGNRGRPGRGGCPVDGARRADAGRHRVDPKLRPRGARRNGRDRLVYQASSPEAIRRHAAAADLPVDEIVKVADTVLVRPDPAAVAA